MGVKLGLLTVRLRMFTNRALRKVNNWVVWSGAVGVGGVELQLFWKVLFIERATCFDLICQ
jgi:hypothetical protein